MIYVVDWKLKIKNVVVIVIENGGWGGGNLFNKFWLKKNKITVKLV